MSSESGDSETSSQGEAPQNLSIDGLIRWVAAKRSDHPQARLASLIDVNALRQDEWVELAAVDLIGQRRGGLDWTVEDYLQELPFLSTQSAWLLDLIDAELCVRREMHEDVSIESLVGRFPDLESSLRQLYFLTTPLNPSVRVQASEVSANQAGESPQRLAQPTEKTKSKSLPQIVNLVGLRGVQEPPLDSQDARSVPGHENLADLATGLDGATIAFEEDRDSEADDFLLQRNLTVAGGPLKVVSREPMETQEDSIDVPIPIRPPQWMTAARCVSTAHCESGRYWLVKGRDSERSESVAMKIIPLPVTIGRKERTRILDLCESSSNVSHPAWIPPRIAAINNGHLAVVRPWVFGRDFVLNRLNVHDQGRLTMLIRVAYALSAAHRVGATHGSVRPGNIIIDHESQVNLVEPASGVAGWEFNLSVWDNDLAKTFPLRVRRDCSALVHLIFQEIIESSATAIQREFSRFIEGVDFTNEDTCADIGEHVQALMDSSQEKRSWWRR